jgi:hypothetical protein
LFINHICFLLNLRGPRVAQQHGVVQAAVQVPGRVKQWSKAGNRVHILFRLFLPGKVNASWLCTGVSCGFQTKENAFTAIIRMAGLTKKNAAKLLFAIEPAINHFIHFNN